MSATRGSSLRTGPVQIGLLVLALITAGVHLYLFAIEGFLGTGTMLPIYQLLFVVNFLAYVILAVVLILPVTALSRSRPVARVLLIAIAVASIIAYFYVGVTDTTGDITKVIEVLLIGLVTVDAGRSGSGQRSARR